MERSVLVVDYIMNNHMTGIAKESLTNAFEFYARRLEAIPKYGLVQGRELIKMVCRSAFMDESITDREFGIICSVCHDPALDNLLLEVNYNEGW